MSAAARLAALLLLLASLPAIAMLALAVRWGSSGPALFFAERVGRGGRRFRLWKLRTMRVDLAGPGVTAHGDPRVTRLGRWLRSSKLDELPSLWNVVAGDLAWVGPRPELPEFVDLDDPRWRRVLSVRPGLTHPVTLRLRHEEDLLARAEGGAERAYRELLLPWKLAGYAAYLEQRTWRSDLAVLAATLHAVVFPCSHPPPAWGEIAAADPSLAASVKDVNR